MIENYPKSFLYASNQQKEITEVTILFMVAFENSGL